MKDKFKLEDIIYNDRFELKIIKVQKRAYITEVLYSKGVDWIPDPKKPLPRIKLNKIRCHKLYKLHYTSLLKNL